MTQNEITSIVLVGVGGQGILLASEITAQAAIACGYDVKTNEVHGMAQRGGSVLAQIRYGQKVYSPLVAKREAKVLYSLERIEALRFQDFLAPGGLAVVNEQVLVPVTVSSGAALYPADAYERLKQTFSKLIYLDAAGIAGALGNIKAANVVLLGAMSLALDLPLEGWYAAIEKTVKPAFVDLNKKAFDEGRTQEHV